MKKSALLLPLMLVIMILAASPSTAQGTLSLPTPVPPEPYPFSDRYPAVVYLYSWGDLQTLYRLETNIDRLESTTGSYISPLPSVSFRPLIATIFINPGESVELAAEGLRAVPIPNESYRAHLAYGPGSGSPEAWPTFDEFVQRMQALEALHPELVDMHLIGNSVQNRGLWCLEISDNVTSEENEPEFRYTSSHHGDETTGIEMTLRLAELLANNYGSDPALTRLVDELETWLCPIYNPDGYVNGSRWNANGFDLNRDYPDRFTDPIDDPAGREPETQAFMVLGYNHRFVMGANYHGGEQVLNYPWDAVAAPGYPIVPAFAPDDGLFFTFGYGYTSRNPDLFGNYQFPYGLTRGWQWYQIWGGMQDWAYLYRGEHHVTIEVSNTKKPAYTQMDYYWNNNRAAMLWWMEQALTGFGGRVLDARDSIPLDAMVTVNGMGMPNFARTDPDVGDYHRVIVAGDYTLTANATGYLGQSAPVTVITGTATTQDFYLCPATLVTLQGTVTEAGSGIPLSATVELIGSPTPPAIANPSTGFYTMSVCPATYTVRASAPLHYPEERTVNISQNQVEDFALLPLASQPDLSPSEKSASSEQALPGEGLQYDIRVENMGSGATATVTDTLPLGMVWSGYLTATQGIPSFAGGAILWQEPLAAGQAVTITYGVSLEQCLPANMLLINLVELDDGVTGVLTRTAPISVENAAPTVPASPSPADGTTDLPITTTLSWAASQDLNCDGITYSVAFGTTNPPPVVVSGSADPFYNPGMLQPGTTYYWYIIATDGTTQVTGPVWSFTTSPLRIYLPVLFRRE